MGKLAGPNDNHVTSRLMIVQDLLNDGNQVPSLSGVATFHIYLAMVVNRTTCIEREKNPENT